MGYKRNSQYMLPEYNQYWQIPTATSVTIRASEGQEALNTTDAQSTQYAQFVYVVNQSGGGGGGGSGNVTVNGMTFSTKTYKENGVDTVVSAENVFDFENYINNCSTQLMIEDTVANDGTMFICQTIDYNAVATSSSWRVSKVTPEGNVIFPSDGSNFTHTAVLADLRAIAWQF